MNSEESEFVFLCMRTYHAHLRKVSKALRVHSTARKARGPHGTEAFNSRAI